MQEAIVGDSTPPPRRLSSVTPPHDPVQGSYQCFQCNRVFKRLEHMKRHEWSHTGWKRFRCGRCGKGFTRSDALARHETSHEASRWPVERDEQASVSNPPLTKRKRACIACAQARERCTKSRPCRRCQTRSLTCVFPSENRQQPPPDQGDEQGDGHEQDNALNNRSVRHKDPSPAPNHGGTWLAEIAPVAKRPTPSTIAEVALETNATLIPPAPSGPAKSFRTQPVGFARPDGDIMRGQGQQHGDFFVPDHASLDAYSYDFPLNWLPVSESFDMVYDSMFGLDGFNAITDQVKPDGPQMYETMLSTPHDGNGDSPSILSHQLRSKFDKPRLQAERRGSTYMTSSLSPNSGRHQSASIYSPSSSDSTSPLAVKSGLYATSTHGARMPCTIRSRAKWSPVRMHNAHPVPVISEDTTLATDATAMPYGFPAGLDQVYFIPGVYAMPPFDKIEENVYVKMKNAFHTYCRLQADDFGYTLFTSDDFPSRDQLDHLVTISFRHVANIIPIIHQASLDVNDYWPLTLAMAAIGCQYTRAIEFQACVSPFHEFVRRVLAVQVQKGQLAARPIPLLQALVLSQVGMLYHGNESLKNLAIRRQGELTTFWRVHGLLQEQVDNEDDQDALWSLPSTEADSLKSSWLLQETRRRVGYSIWWLDCLMEIHFATEAVLDLSLAKADLPNDVLWESNEEGVDWTRLAKSNKRNPSLLSAVQQLFHEKLVKTELGEFSKILLLHGIYQEIFQIKKFTERPLSTYIPLAAQAAPPLTATAPKDKAAVATAERNQEEKADLDKVAMLQSWRNTALDCIDALHWDANAVIALSRGTEHPTVMHLHLSRVVLLVPYNQIVKLASFVSSSSDKSYPSSHNATQPELTAAEAITAEQHIVEWARRDESKARLAALHSATLYWHIRRFSSMAFYEPASLFLATLTLWAYSSYTLKESGQPRSPKHLHRPGNMTCAGDDFAMHGETPPESDGDDPQPSTTAEGAIGPPQEQNTSQVPREYIPQPHLQFMHLDRPCDDEMVQSFVRLGRPSNITAYITGVGDICAPEAPVRIIQEGVRILDSVSLSWGRTLMYRRILVALGKATIGSSPSMP